MKLRESSKRNRDESNELRLREEERHQVTQAKALAREDLPLRRTLVVDMLWINYDPEAWWWRFVEHFIEKGLLAIMIQFCIGDQEVINCAAILLTMLMASYYMKPFHEDEDDFMYIVGRASNVTNVLCALALTLSERHASAGTHHGWVSPACLVVLFVVAVAIRVHNHPPPPLLRFFAIARRVPISFDGQFLGRDSSHARIVDFARGPITLNV